MAKTKIVVVSLKEIIRTSLFVIAALAFILLLIYLFIPKDKEASLQNEKYISGVYTSNITLEDNYTTVHVTVDENNILAVEVEPLDEALAVFYPLLAPTAESVSNQIIENQSTNITATIDNLYTSRVIVEAVDKALEEAKLVE